LLLWRAAPDRRIEESGAATPPRAPFCAHADTGGDTAGGGRYTLAPRKEAAMTRAMVVTVAVGCLVLGLAVGFGGGAEAQGGDRVAALETRVANLEGRVRDQRFAISEHGLTIKGLEAGALPPPLAVAPGDALIVPLDGERAFRLTCAIFERPGTQGLQFDLECVRWPREAS
jgi:hypothetical protein